MRPRCLDRHAITGRRGRPGRLTPLWSRHVVAESTGNRWSGPHSGNDGGDPGLQRHVEVSNTPVEFHTGAPGTRQRKGGGVFRAGPDPGRAALRCSPAVPYRRYAHRWRTAARRRHPHLPRHRHHRIHPGRRHQRRVPHTGRCRRRRNLGHRNQIDGLGLHDAVRAGHTAALRQSGELHERPESARPQTHH